MSNRNDPLNLVQKIVIGLFIAFILMVFYGSYLDYVWLKSTLN